MSSGAVNLHHFHAKLEHFGKGRLGRVGERDQDLVKLGRGAPHQVVHPDGAAMRKGEGPIGAGDQDARFAGRRAADHYRGVILAEQIQDNTENFTRFVLLRPAAEAARALIASDARKMSLAMRIAHRPGALLASLEPFARHNINLRKIESRPIHGQPWVYQFVLEIEADQPERLEDALAEVRKVTRDLRVMGLYAAAKIATPTSDTTAARK